MPLEQPAMMLMVPVGAIVVTVALRTRAPAGLSKIGALEVGEHAALAGQLLAGRAGLVVDEAHDIAGDLAGVFGVVGHLEAQQHVGEAHDAETDLAVALGHPLDLGQRVAIDVDDVVQEAHRGAHDAAEGAVVDVAVGHDPAEVDGAQVAALVGQQGLLAARVGALDLAQLRRGVVRIDAVDEDDAGVAVLPGQRDHAVENLAGLQGAHHVAGARVDQRVVLVGVDGAHEGVGDGHRDVEVVEAVVVLLGPDEVEDVRVIDAHDAHVGAAPRAALLDGLGGGIEDVHEGERAAGDALGAHHHVVVRAHAREAEAGAPAALVDESGVLDGLEDGLHGVADGEYEAGRELAQLAAGVHEGGAVGEELEAGHELVEGGLPLFDGGGGVVQTLGLRDGAGDAPEHLFGCLELLAVLALLEVAALEHLECIGGELYHCLLCVSHAPCPSRSRPPAAAR